MKTIYNTVVLGLLTGAVNAQSFTSVADFSGFSHGNILTGSEYNSLGVGFNFQLTTRANTPQPTPTNTAIIFGTNERNTADSDVEGPFIGGNLQGSDLGNVLIFAENLLDGDGDGLVDSPDDNENGGVITFTFNASGVSEFGFALVDAPQFVTDFNIEFFSDTGASNALTLGEYIALTGTLNFDAGDNKANQFANVTASGLGLTNIQSVVLDLDTSGGIDNVTFVSSVPEPSTALLSLIGLGFIARRRR